VFADLVKSFAAQATFPTLRRSDVVGSLKTVKIDCPQAWSKLPGAMIYAGIKGATQRRAVSGGGSMQNILLIDDDPNQHELFSFYLDETFGSDCPFVSTYTLDEALAELRKQSFDVIFLDNRLRPHHSYTETIGAIGELSGDSEIYLISAARESERLGDYKAHGIVDAIDKFELRQAISDGLIGTAGRLGLQQACS